MTWQIVILILGLILGIPLVWAVNMAVWGRIQADLAESQAIQPSDKKMEPERANEWQIRRIEVEDDDSGPIIADSPLDTPNMPEYDEAERLLTEMPRILNPIDPMDGVLPDIDRDWAANLVEQEEELERAANPPIQEGE